VLVEDGITAALNGALDRDLLSDVATLTVGDIKRRLLSRAGPSWADRYRQGLSSEVIAAVAKVMTDEELSRVCRSIFNPLPAEGISIGSRSHFGSRIQPNSPGDDEQEILLSILEGLSYHCGDVIIGLNPAGDDLESIVRLEELLARVVDVLQLPTR